MNSPAKHSVLPILLLSAAGFTVLTTEFVIVGLLPAMARDLRVSVTQAGLLVTLFAFTVAVVGPALTAWLPGMTGRNFSSARCCSSVFRMSSRRRLPTSG